MLEKLAKHLRAMHLYYHMAHNMVKGPLFNQDHSTLNGFYDECDNDYDRAVERAINKEGPVSANLSVQLKEIYQLIKNKPCCDVAENKEYFIAAEDLEKELCLLIEGICKQPGVSQGTIQLVGDIADRSEVRQYKITQRLGGKSSPEIIISHSHDNEEPAI